MKTFALLFGVLILFGIFANFAIADSDSEEEKNVIREGIKTGIGEIKQEVENRIKEKDGKIESRIKEKIENEEERKKIIREFKERIREKNGVLEIEGERVIININESGRKEIIKGKIKAKTDINLTTEGNETIGEILRAILSNGRFADIRIMPDRAALAALEQLKAKCEGNICKVELKEVGSGEKKKIVYELETEKDGRLLFIFKMKMKVKAEIDPETGEVTKIRKPWWRILIKEKDEIVNGDEILEKETKVEIRGNIELSEEIQNTIKELVASLENTEGKVKIDIRAEKEGNITIFQTNKNGTITDNQKTILEKLEAQLRKLVEETEGQDIKLRIKIAYKVKIEDDEDEGIEKVVLCHIPPGNETAAATITVGRAAVKAHLAHGDYLGACVGGDGNETEPGNETGGNNTSPGNGTNNTQNNFTV